MRAFSEWGDAELPRPSERITYQRRELDVVLREPALGPPCGVGYAELSHVRKISQKIVNR